MNLGSMSSQSFMQIIIRQIKDPNFPALARLKDETSNVIKYESRALSNVTGAMSHGMAFNLRTTASSGSSGSADECLYQSRPQH